jgi:hypothetical protein
VVRIAFVLGVLAVLACGCASGPHGEVRSAAQRADADAAVTAYDALRAAQGPHGGALALVASAVLESAARGDDRSLRDAALSELTTAGVAAEPVLRRLAEASDVDTAVRARALSVLASRGRRGQRAELRRLVDHEDPEVVAWAVTALDPGRDRERLVADLSDPTAVVRVSAAKVLAGARRSVDVRRALVPMVRRDPSPRVRAAAAGALAGQGPAVLQPLRKALADPVREVRGAAAGALLQVGTDEAFAALGRALATSPSPDSIEVARRVLAAGRGTDLPEALRGEAQDHLVAALLIGSGSLRAQAAVAASSVPVHDALEAALVEALDDEDDDAVRWALARTLDGLHAPRDALARAFRSLAEGEGVPAVQASAVLARDGDADAEKRLEGFMREGTPLVRTTAACAMACEVGAPDRARSSLRDEDASVRVRAAGAILRCARR